jgi:hypothetical protein
LLSNLQPVLTELHVPLQTIRLSSIIIVLNACGQPKLCDIDIVVCSADGDGAAKLVGPELTAPGCAFLTLGLPLQQEGTVQ